MCDLMELRKLLPHDLLVTLIFTFPCTAAESTDVWAGGRMVISLALLCVNNYYFVLSLIDCDHFPNLISFCSDLCFKMPLRLHPNQISVCPPWKSHTLQLHPKMCESKANIAQ